MNAIAPPSRPGDAAPLQPSAPAPPQGQPLLRAQGLSIGHGDTVIQEGLDFTLTRGEVLVVAGASGCGKSTLLRVLAGLALPQQGQMAVDGRLAQPADIGALATLVPQDAEIFEATVRENLDFGEALPPAALQRAVQASALDDVLLGLPHGLDTVLAERGSNLSGGQRQRLALARGLLAAHDSSLLLLDEPTSALDAAIEQHVQQRLNQAFAGACMVAAVHRLELLEHFDRVAWMVAGEVLDIGTVAQVQARQPAFAALLAASRSGRRDTTPGAAAALPSASPA